MKACGPVLVFALLLAPASAFAAGRLLSETGTLKAGDRILKAGDELPNSEVRLASGTATLAIDGGRFLLKGPAKLTPKKSEFRLNLGGLLSAITRRAGRHFSVRTPAAVAAVRGTDFFVEVGPRQQTKICICKGELLVTAKGMDPLTMKSQHHEERRFWPAKRGTVPEPAEMSDHSDEEIAALHVLLDAEKP